jgi:hypothetical protein
VHYFNKNYLKCKAKFTRKPRNLQMLELKKRTEKQSRNLEVLMLMCAEGLEPRE